MDENSTTKQDIPWIEKILGKNYLAIIAMFLIALVVIVIVTDSNRYDVRQVSERSTIQIEKLTKSDFAKEDYWYGRHLLTDEWYLWIKSTTSDEKIKLTKMTDITFHRIVGLSSKDSNSWHFWRMRRVGDSAAYVEE